jgi:DNA-binding transcriptional LysR family regulator
VENRFVNIVSEGLDAGIRLIEAIDRDMVQVRLTPPCRVVVAGAPSYLKRNGVPETPTDLLKHDCLCFRWAPDDEPRPWELERGKKTWRVPVRGPVTVSDTELLHTLALRGRGLIYALDAVIAPHLERGRLRVVLERYAPSVPGLFLYFPSRAQVSPALRAFVTVAREIANAS